jgi:hypothetical protein
MIRLSAVFPTSLPLFAAVAVVCTQLGAGQVRAGAEDVESAETRTAMKALVKENELLQRQLREAEESKAGLQKNLAIATGEAEVLKRQLMELHLRLEAFGLQGQGGETGLEQRLLKAVSALRAAEEQKSSLATAVITLLDSVEKSRQSASEADAETKAMLEAAVRQGHRALAEVDETKAQSEAAGSASQTVHEGSVIAIKEELALVVTSLGREGGVKVGMPFRVIRGEQELGSVRIVDVRDRISGAVVQELSSDSEKIRVGDKLKIGVDRRL